MTVNLNPRDPLAVRPVVDYEPPVRDVRLCRQASRAALRGHTTPVARSTASREPSDAMSPALRPAAVFAEAALRRVLEVIDRRRPASQLRPLLVAALLDSVLSVNQVSAGHQSAALLRRVRVQAVGRQDPYSPATAAEVFGTYSRGRRIHAIACRVEQVPATNGTQWQVVALHIG